MTDTLIINEIFYSIQGESSHAGLPCVFIRLTGCHLRCAWCDTPYAFTAGAPLSLDDIVTRVRGYDCPLLEITGGEPLLQANTLPLLTRFCDLGMTVLLETSGTMDVSPVDPRVIKVMDLKCPSSGESNRNRYENISHLARQDEVKFVLANRADYDWARQTVARHRLTARCHVLFSPVWEALPVKTLAEWILADRLPVRLQTQLHKQIWGPGVPGV